MSEGLQALNILKEELKSIFCNKCKEVLTIEKELRRLDEYDNTEYSALIESHKKLLKEKKALEIIKEKIKIDFNDHYFGFKDNYYIIVNHDVFGAIKVDKEQFDLLKEVLS